MFTSKDEIIRYINNSVTRVSRTEDYTFQDEKDILREGSYLFYDFKDIKDTRTDGTTTYEKEVSPLFSESVINNRDYWDILSIITEDIPFYHLEPNMEVSDLTENTHNTTTLANYKRPFMLSSTRDSGTLDVPSIMHENSFYNTWFRDAIGYINNKLILDVYNKLKFPYINENYYMNATLFTSIAKKAFSNVIDTGTTSQTRSNYLDFKDEKGAKYEFELDTIGSSEYLDEIVNARIDSMYQMLDYSLDSSHILSSLVESKYMSGELKYDMIDRERTIFRLQDIKHELLRRKFAGSSTLYTLALSSIGRKGSFIGTIPAMSVAESYSTNRVFSDKRELRMVAIPGVTTKVSFDNIFNPTILYYTYPTETGIGNAMPLGTVLPLYYSSENKNYNEEDFFSMNTSSPKVLEDMDENVAFYNIPTPMIDESGYVINNNYPMKHLSDIVEWESLRGLNDIDSPIIRYRTLDEKVFKIGETVARAYISLDSDTDDIKMSYGSATSSRRESNTLDYGQKIIDTLFKTGYVLDMNADSLLYHSNTIQGIQGSSYEFLTYPIANGNSVSIMDLPWLNYLSDSIVNKSKVNSTVEIGAQISNYMQTEVPQTAEFSFFGISYSADDMGLAGERETLEQSYDSYVSGSSKWAYIWYVTFHYRVSSFRIIKVDSPRLITKIALKGNATYWDETSEKLELINKIYDSLSYNIERSVGLLPFTYKNLSTLDILMTKIGAYKNNAYDGFEEKGLSEAFFMFSDFSGISERRGSETSSSVNFFGTEPKDNKDIGTEYISAMPSENTKAVYYVVQRGDSFYWSDPINVIPFTNEFFNSILNSEFKPEWKELGYHLNPYLNFIKNSASTLRHKDSLAAVDFSGTPTKFRYRKLLNPVANVTYVGDAFIKNDDGTFSGVTTSNSAPGLLAKVGEDYYYKIKYTTGSSGMTALSNLTRHRGMDFTCNDSGELPSNLVWDSISVVESGSNYNFYGMYLENSSPREGMIVSEPRNFRETSSIYGDNRFKHFLDDTEYTQIPRSNIYTDATGVNCLSIKIPTYSDVSNEETRTSMLSIVPCSRDALLEDTDTLNTMVNNLKRHLGWTTASIGEGLKENCARLYSHIKSWWDYEYQPNTQAERNTPINGITVCMNVMPTMESLYSLNKGQSVTLINRGTESSSSDLFEFSISIIKESSTQYKYTDSTGYEYIYSDKNSLLPINDADESTYRVIGGKVKLVFKYSYSGYAEDIQTIESEVIDLPNADFIITKAKNTTGDETLLREFKNIDKSARNVITSNVRILASALIKDSGDSSTQKNAKKELLLTLLVGNNKKEQTVKDVSQIKKPTSLLGEYLGSAPNPNTINSAVNSLKITVGSRLDENGKQVDIFEGNIYDLRLYNEGFQGINAIILNQGLVRELYSYSPSSYKLGHSIYNDMGVFKEVKNRESTFANVKHIRLFSRSVWDSILLDMYPVSKYESFEQSYLYKMDRINGSEDYYDPRSDTDIYEFTGLTEAGNATYKLSDCIQQTLIDKVEVLNSAITCKVNYNGSTHEIEKTGNVSIVTTMLKPVFYKDWPFISFNYETNSTPRFEYDEDAHTIGTLDGYEIYLPREVTITDGKVRYSADIEPNLKSSVESNFTRYLASGTNIVTRDNNSYVARGENSSTKVSQNFIEVPLVVPYQKNISAAIDGWLDRFYLKNVKLNSALVNFLTASSYYDEVRLPNMSMNSDGIIAPISKWDAIRTLREGTYYFTSKYPMQILPTFDSDFNSRSNYNILYGAIRFKIEVTGTPVEYSPTDYDLKLDSNQCVSGYTKDRETLRSIFSSQSMASSALYSNEAHETFDNRTFPHRVMNIRLYAMDVPDDKYDRYAGMIDSEDNNNKEIYSYNWKLLASNVPDDLKVKGNEGVVLLNSPSSLGIITNNVPMFLHKNYEFPFFVARKNNDGYDFLNPDDDIIEPIRVAPIYDDNLESMRDNLLASSEEDLDKLVLTAGKTYNLVFEYNSKVTESCFIDKTYSDKANWSWESEIADLPFAEELSNSNVINEKEFMYTKVFNSTSTSDTNIKNKYCGFEYDNGSWRKSNSNTVHYLGNPYSRSSTNNYLVYLQGNLGRDREDVNDGYYFSYTQLGMQDSSKTAIPSYSYAPLSHIYLATSSNRIESIECNEATLVASNHNAIVGRIRESIRSLSSSHDGLLSGISSISPYIRYKGIGDSYAKENYLKSINEELLCYDVSDRSLGSSYGDITLTRSTLLGNNLISEPIAPQSNVNHWSVTDFVKDNATASASFNHSYATDSDWDGGLGKDVLSIECIGGSDKEGANSLYTYIPSGRATINGTFEISINAKTIISGSTAAKPMNDDVMNGLKDADDKESYVDKNLSIKIWAVLLRNNLKKKRVLLIPTKKSQGNTDSSWYVYSAIVDSNDAIDTVGFEFAFDKDSINGSKILVTKPTVRIHSVYTETLSWGSQYANTNDTTFVIPSHKEVFLYNKYRNTYTYVQFSNPINDRANLLTSYKLEPKAYNDKFSEVIKPWVSRLSFRHHYDEDGEDVNEFEITSYTKDASNETGKMGKTLAQSGQGIFSVDDASIEWHGSLVEKEEVSSSNEGDDNLKNNFISISDLKFNSSSFTGLNTGLCGTNLFIDSTNVEDSVNRYGRGDKKEYAEIDEYGIVSVTNETFTSVSNNFTKDLINIETGEYTSYGSAPVAITNIQLISDETEKTNNRKEILYEYEYLPIVYDEKSNHISVNLFIYRPASKDSNIEV